MIIDLSSKGVNGQLSRFEILFLVNGIQNLDRYEEVTIRAHRAALAQIKLVTRWADHYEDGRLVPGVVSFEEIPKPIPVLHIQSSTDPVASRYGC